MTNYCESSEDATFNVKHLRLIYLFDFYKSGGHPNPTKDDIKLMFSFFNNI